MQKRRRKVDKVIIHYHGGGFIAMDTASAQGSTRFWANQLGVPIFSVDYRLAPKYPFPDPINDCYQAYVWLITQAKEQLGMDIDKVILTGDSAGGHLCLSVTLLCLLRGFRVPDGIVLLYPSLTMDIDRFYPSSLMMSDDEILSTSFVAFCSACVIRKGGNPKANPLISPVVAPDCLLRLLP